MKMKDHIRPPSATSFTLGIISKGDIIVLSHSNGITLINTANLDMSPDTVVPVKNIVGVAGRETSSLAAICSDGKIESLTVKYQFTISETVENPNDVKKKRSPLDIFESDDDEDLKAKVKPKQTVRKKKEKKTRKLVLDEASDDDVDDMEEEVMDDLLDDEGEVTEYELDDYSVHESEDGEMVIDRPATPLPIADVSRPTCIHKPFQPSSTEFIHNYRFLCWNSFGLITSRRDDGYYSVEVEFHDKNFHRPIRFIDEQGFTMGSVGQSGAIFASPPNGESGQPGVIYMSPLDSQERTAPWTIQLNNAEDALGVAIGGGKYAVVATTAGYLRTFTSTGLQGPIINFLGWFVSMAANNDQMLLIFADEMTSDLSYAIYNLDSMSLLRNGHIGGRFRNVRLKWIGLSDSNIAGIFDEKMVLHICNPDTNYTWQPWLSCDTHWSRNENVWPITFNTQELVCLLVKGGEEHPETLPRPLQTTLPMQVPFLGMDDQLLMIPYEHVYRTSTILRSESLCPPSISDREMRKLQLASDKHVLELVQLAIKADKPARILELCPLFMMERSWDVAVQLVRHNRLLQLADRIEMLKDQLASGATKPTERTEPPQNRIRTPRMSSRLALESPGTLLANLTPLGKEKEGSNDGSLFETSQEAVMCTMQMASNRMVSNDPIPSAEPSLPISNPFSKLSFDAPPKSEGKPRSFVEMMKSVQLASSEIPTQPLTKKYKPDVAITATERPKKQADLSLFAKHSTMEVENAPTGQLNE